jgi:hypothetical protein
MNLIFKKKSLIENFSSQFNKRKLYTTIIPIAAPTISDNVILVVENGIIPSEMSDKSKKKIN